MKAAAAFGPHVIPGQEGRGVSVIGGDCRSVGKVCGAVPVWLSGQ